MTNVTLCSRHRSYQAKRPPTADCLSCRQAFKKKHLFTLAIIKGLMEHGLLDRHFGSTLALNAHVQIAIESGYLMRDKKTGGVDWTPAGRRLYDEMKLKDAPEGRATFWVVAPWFEEKSK